MDSKSLKSFKMFSVDSLQSISVVSTVRLTQPDLLVKRKYGNASHQRSLSDKTGHTRAISYVQISVQIHAIRFHTILVYVLNIVGLRNTVSMYFFQGSVGCMLGNFGLKGTHTVSNKIELIPGTKV